MGFPLEYQDHISSFILSLNLTTLDIRIRKYLSFLSSNYVFIQQNLKLNQIYIHFKQDLLAEH